jgi:hypothetical protein
VLVGAQLLRKLWRRRADQDHGFRVLHHVSDPVAQVESASVAAGDQDHGRTGKSVERDAARVRVGRLGVVVPADPGPLADKLEPVLDALEGADRGVDQLVTQSGDATHGRGR